MWLVTLLLACPASDVSDGSPSRQDSSEGACDYDDPEVTTLAAWDTSSSAGYSAAEAFGWALGEHTDELAWDDGSRTTLTLTVSPVATTQTSYGPDCPHGPMLDLSVTMAVATDDGRLALDVDGAWTVENAVPGVRYGDVNVSAELDDIGIPRLAEDSALSLRAAFDDGGTFAFVVEEAWDVDAETWRVCRRAATDGDLDCRDYGDTMTD